MRSTMYPDSGNRHGYRPYLTGGGSLKPGELAAGGSYCFAKAKTLGSSSENDGVRSRRVKPGPV